MNENEKSTIEDTVENVEEVTKEEINVPSMDDFTDELNSSFTKLFNGDIVEGTIISVSESEILVNIGYISDGIITVEESMASSIDEFKELYKEGDTIKAEVLKKDDGEGNVLLSIKKANQILAWDELQEAFDNQTKFNVKVKEVVKGGVICNIKGVRAFIPASLLSVRYVEDLNEFVGKELKVKIVDFNKEDKKVVLSRKEIEIEEKEKKKNELLSSIKKNDRYTGKVVKLMNFGAFVDIGGLEGLIHNNDLSWTKVKHPSEIVKEGDAVNVYILDVDKKRGRVALGLKDVNDDPWGEVFNKFSIGKVYEGTVERLMSYGAFVKIDSGVEGLVHISEISDKRIENTEEVLEIGDTVKVKIISIDKDARKIKLSIKEAILDADKAELDKYKTDEQATTNLEDVFKVFLKDIK